MVTMNPTINKVIVAPVTPRDDIADEVVVVDIGVAVESVELDESGVESDELVSDDIVEAGGATVLSASCPHGYPFWM